MLVSKNCLLVWGRTSTHLVTRVSEVRYFVQIAKRVTRENDIGGEKL